MYSENVPKQDHLIEFFSKSTPSLATSLRHMATRPGIFNHCTDSLQTHTGRYETKWKVSVRQLGPSTRRIIWILSRCTFEVTCSAPLINKVNFEVTHLKPDHITASSPKIPMPAMMGFTAIFRQDPRESKQRRLGTSAAQRLPRYGNQRWVLRYRTSAWVARAHAQCKLERKDLMRSLQCVI